MPGKRWDARSESKKCSAHWAAENFGRLTQQGLHLVSQPSGSDLALEPSRRCHETRIPRHLARCTDEEIAHWQNGGSFPDPWPANLRLMA